jgi:DNA-binding NtrC family response regulator
MPQRELAPSARVALAAYSWPGNVRELRNSLEQAGMLTDNISLTAEDFAAILPISAEVTTAKKQAVSIVAADAGYFTCDPLPEDCRFRNCVWFLGMCLETRQFLKSLYSMR